LNASLATFVTGVDQVFRPGDDSRSAQELDVAQAALIRAQIARLLSLTVVVVGTLTWQV
jgi:hypothetical protein